MSRSNDYNSRHPLDIDLADFAAGRADQAEAERLETHLAGCLLCRIKLRRLRDAESLASGTISDIAEPGDTDAIGTRPEHLSFFVPEGADGNETHGAASPSEVWSAGDDERVLILVAAVHDDRVLAAPVTFDVETADDETVAVDAAHSPFGEPVAVYPTLAIEVPRSALKTRLGSLAEPAEVGNLIDGSMSGTWRGAPIVDLTDPRLEFRQLLVDRLGSLEEVPPDPGTGSDAPPPRPEEIASALASELSDRRGQLCGVKSVNFWGDAAPARARGWVPIATVEEVGVVVVVFDTPQGLTDDIDFDAARSVLTRFNASAVLVLQTPVSPLADLYNPSALNYGIDVPSGDWTPPRPLLPALAPVDAITKFLEQSTSLTATAWPTRAAVPQVDVSVVLSQAVTTALAEIGRQANRARIEPKVRGYSSLQGIADKLDQVLRGAFDDHSIVEGLMRVAEEHDQ
jgi:hypothetical protein